MLKLYQKIGLIIILFALPVFPDLSEPKNRELLLISPKRLLKVNESVKITASIEGDNAQGYTYFWWATAGEITGSGNEISYTAPGQKGTVEIYVEVTDKQNTVYKQSVFIPVYKQIGFLKADDMEFIAKSTISPQWEKFIDYMEERQIKVGIGLVCNSLEIGNQEYFSRLKEIHQSGYFELFNHGYDHVLNEINENGEIYSEFYNTSYEEQKEHLQKAQNLAKEKLDITLHAFGAPGNAIDDNTTKAIEEVTDLKTWFFGKTEFSRLVLKSGGIIESPAFNPNFGEFIRHYHPDVDHYVFQIHPNKWNEEQFDIFVRILDFLVQREMSFLTPYEYYELTRTLYNLTIESIPETGASITIVPNDINNKGDGNTVFMRTFEKNTTVTLNAPAAYKGKGFSRWIVDGVENTNRTVQVIMDDNLTAAVYYETQLPPEIALNRTNLNFSCISDCIFHESQTVNITNSGDGVMEWTASGETPWLTIEPSSGTNFGTLDVSINPDGLKAGVYTGAISVTAPSAVNSPQWVNITLNVYNAKVTHPPFGEFSTPISGSTVSSSIAVTGWVLDDIGVKHVKIYSGESFIGDAVFVEGARPDIEEAYPGYPNNYRAGWGYMLLTNFLPEGGHGVYTLYAIAADLEGKQITLGSKTVTVDNKNAVKPFGAIDTPAQGGTISGSSYINQGWVLTPMPNKVPEDGSTIEVYVDGVKLGNPLYNISRSDILNLLPEYANSEGAGASFTIDTTAFSNGIHSIYWVAADNAGNTDGIGSRFFSIQNADVTGAAKTLSLINTKKNKHPFALISQLEELAVDCSSPVWVIKGYKNNAEAQAAYPQDNGITHIEINELERLVIRSSDSSTVTKPSAYREISSKDNYAGYLVKGTQLKPLPIGSTVDTDKGIFYWVPCPGYIGSYLLVFINKDQKSLNYIDIKIAPRH
jgi:peptidoglycan/xylan/chitin deacetylase (PgdA/CDA1 family)